MSVGRGIVLCALGLSLLLPAVSAAQSQPEDRDRSGVTLGQVQVDGAHEPLLSNAASPPLSEREQFLGWLIAAMTAVALASVALHGRVTARTHVALAALAVLVGGFGVFVLLQSGGAVNPWVGAACFVGIFALLRMLSQFERH